MRNFPENIAIFPLFPFGPDAPGCKSGGKVHPGVIRFISPHGVNAEELLKQQEGEARRFCLASAPHFLKQLGDKGLCRIVAAHPNHVEIEYPPEVALGLLQDSLLGSNSSSTPEPPKELQRETVPSETTRSPRQCGALCLAPQQIGSPLHELSPAVDAIEPVQPENESNASAHSTTTPNPAQG